uniref:FAS1 domain-containing protein n=1 Tax=Glossina austeni TaxID=7395 RepID=A0A1A9VEI5_GLOAU
MTSFVERPLSFFFVPLDMKAQDTPLHVVNAYLDLATSNGEIYTRVASHHPGGYYVHFTRFPSSVFFVNNLRIKGKIGFAALKTNSLTPLNLHDNASEAYPSVNPNPNAWEFLQNIQYYQYGDYYNISLKNYFRNLSNFWDRVITCAMERHYQEGEQRTFFIPTNDAFKEKFKRYHVNAKTILTNIVEEAMIFPLEGYDVKEDHNCPTLAWAKGHPILVRHNKERSKYCWNNMQKSEPCTPNENTILYSVFVSNGVINFINTTLGLNEEIIQGMQPSEEDDEEGEDDDDVEEEEKEEAIGHNDLRKFAQKVHNVLGPEMFFDIFNNGNFTLVVPDYEKWNESGFDKLREEEKANVLKMHVIQTEHNVRIDEDVIRAATAGMYAKFATLSGHSKLYFDRQGGRRAFITVEGCGVNASVLTNDVNEGHVFFHVIEKVLCIPTDNVAVKLRESFFNFTRTLGSMSFFNDQLRNMDRKFTYFVPSDYAWERAAEQFPEVVRKLQLPDFNFHLQYFLERHLVISDKVFTMKDLLEWTKENDGEIALPTLREYLHIKVEEKYIDYILSWRTQAITVHHDDVLCTNGIIHVLDFPLMEKDDFGAATSYNINFYLHFIILMLFIGRI